MKKYIFFLLALWIPMMAWADNAITHKLTIEVGSIHLGIRVASADDNKSVKLQTIKKDSVRIDTCQLNEGSTYKITISPSYSDSNTRINESFTAWMRDGSFYSTSPEITIAVGKSDIYLTAAVSRNMTPPYSPGANYFDAATKTLTLDEIRDGNLQTIYSYSAAASNYQFKPEDVEHLVVIGYVQSRNSNHDMYNLGNICSLTSPNLKNLRSIDLSQMSGITTLGESYLSSIAMANLHHIALGASIDSIGEKAFYLVFGNNFSNDIIVDHRYQWYDTLDCYSVTPPRCHAKAFYNTVFDADVSLYNYHYRMVLRVPPESVEEYKQAPLWKDIPIIEPLYETTVVSVKIPTDAPDGYYDDMTVELKNLRSQLVQSLPVLNKREFKFYGQIQGSEYQATLKNAYGQVMGQTEPMELGEEELTLTIDKLLRAKDASVKVTIPDGTDVSDKVSVMWTDEADNAIGHTSRLKAIAEGTRLSCAVKLRSELARQYVAPDKMQLTVDAEGDNLLALRLQPVQQTTLHGFVKDQQTGEAVADATVSLTQQQGDGYTEAVTATTDENGRYTLQGTNEHGELSVTAPGYLPKTLQMGVPAADGALPDVEIELFNGVIVNTWFTYTTTVAEGEEAQVIDGYDAYTDAAYQVYNKTKGSPITDFINKQGRLYFTTGVETGDELTVTASSHNNSFSPVSATCEISNNGLGHVTLPIVQKGALAVTATYPEDVSIMGVLYDANGRFVRSNTYKSGALRFDNLASGDYSLISMTTNSLLRRVLLMSTLDDMKLVEGTDYAKTAVHITDGRILSVDVPNVPELDKTKLSYTKSSWTTFIADKNVLNLGQTNTVSSQVFFANQYAGRISDVELVVDIPEEIDIVDNSTLSGSTTGSYRIENGQYVFPMENMENNLLRFCLKPLQAGEFRVTGSVRFKLDGVEMIQPIGTVWVKVNGFAMKSVVFITPFNLVITGDGPIDYSGNKIDIYDYNQLVAITSIDSDGEWSAEVQYPASLINRQHAIKARMTVPDAGVIESDVKYITYDINSKVASRVVMLDQLKQPINFNYYDSSSEEQYYTYILKKYWWTYWKQTTPYTTEFTFLAYFDDLDILSVESMKINVLASDGSTRTLEAEYDATRKCWYAISDYPSPSKLPISAYAYSEGVMPPMSDDEKAAREETWTNAIDRAMKVAMKAAGKGEIEVMPSDDESLKLKYTVGGKEPFDFTIKDMDYDEAATYVMQNEPFVLKGDEGSIVYTLVNGEDEAEMIIVDVDEHTAMRTVISHAEINAPAASLRRKIPGNKKILIGKGGNIASDMLDLVGLKEYIEAPMNLDLMNLYLDMFQIKTDRRISQINELLSRRCVVSGEPWYTIEQRTTYRKFLNGLEQRRDKLMDELEGYINSYTENLYKKGAIDLATTLGSGGAGKAVLLGLKKAPKVYKMYSKANRYMESENGVMISGQAGFWSEVTDIAPPDIAELLDIDFSSIYQKFLNKSEIQGTAIENSLKELNDNIFQNRRDCTKDCQWWEEDCDEECEGEDCKRKPDCEGDDCDPDPDPDPDPEPDDDDPPHGPRPCPQCSDYPKDPPSTPKRHHPHPHPKPARPFIDPSGFVYEAVQSNRVEGATATIYYKDFMLTSGGSSAGESDVLWDAEKYGQINPQITGTDGMYQWDVPQGLWQVRVQKEGYANTQTDWLPVPPPQLDINIPIVRMRLPKVERAHAYEEAVAVKFDSYMTPATLNTELITVTENNAVAEGTIELTDEEAGDGGATYASKLRFVPEKPFTANEVTLRISGEVQSYSGIEMDEPFEAVLPIEREVKKLIADESVKIAHGGAKLLHVKAEPAAAAAGKTVTVNCLSGIITSAAQTRVVLNNSGEAAVLIHGDIPGKDFVTFTMDDSELAATSTVRVSSKSADTMVQAPEASIPSGTEVDKGTQITLSCPTEGAQIYYTLDGSSPYYSDTRILYDGAPVTINEETTLLAVAVVESIGESELVTFHYTVKLDSKINNLTGNGISITPLRVYDTFEVTGADGTFAVTVYSVTGQLLMRHNQLTSGQKVNVSALPAGLYLVEVNGTAAYLIQRIIKE